MIAALYGSFRLLGWGLVLVLIDIRILTIDLLPDFAGYMLVAFALRTIGRTHPAFNKAKWTAVCLVLLSMPRDFAIPPISYEDFSAIPLAMHMYMQAILALHTLLAFWLCSSMAEIARQDHRKLLLDSIILRKNLFLLFQLLHLILFPFLLNTGNYLLLLFMAMSAFSFLLELLYVRLPFRLSKPPRRLL